MDRNTVLRREADLREFVRDDCRSRSGPRRSPRRRSPSQHSVSSTCLERIRASKCSAIPVKRHTSRVTTRPSAIAASSTSRSFPRYPRTRSRIERSPLRRLRRSRDSLQSARRDRYARARRRESNRKSVRTRPDASRPCSRDRARLSYRVVVARNSALAPASYADPRRPVHRDWKTDSGSSSLLIPTARLLWVARSVDRPHLQGKRCGAARADASDAHDFDHPVDQPIDWRYAANIASTSKNSASWPDQ